MRAAVLLLSVGLAACGLIEEPRLLPPGLPSATLNGVPAMVGEFSWEGQTDPRGGVPAIGEFPQAIELPGVVELGQPPLGGIGFCVYSSDDPTICDVPAVLAPGVASGTDERRITIAQLPPHPRGARWQIIRMAANFTQQPDPPQTAEYFWLLVP